MSGLSDSRKGRHSGGQRLRIEHSIAIPGKYVCNLREEMIPPGERAEAHIVPAIWRSHPGSASTDRG